MLKKPLTVAWISDFPVEWLPDIPEPLRNLPKRHPATWQMVLLSEFEKNPDLRVHVVLLRRRIQRDFSFERNGTAFHVLKAYAWLRLASLFGVDTLLIRRLCRQIQPELVHAWGAEKGAATIAPRLGYPYLLTVQGLFAWYKKAGPLPAYYRFIELLERGSLPRAPLVTTESSFAIEFLRKRYPRLEICQAEHAPSQAFFDVRREPQTDPLHFIAIGTPSYRKGTDLLFKALDQLSHELQFKLTMICGPDTRYVDSLRRLVSQGLWQRVEFKHDLLPDEVACELERPTMLLLPTRADVSPNAVKEAVVAGVPVVVAETGGIPDYVQTGRNGLLFPPGDLNAFIQTIRAAVKHPLFGRGQVEPEFLARSREYLSPARMALNFLAAYERALALCQGGAKTVA
jgi:glycosyltransferase involved in cell wall biosynthesis